MFRRKGLSSDSNIVDHDPVYSLLRWKYTLGLSETSLCFAAAINTN